MGDGVVLKIWVFHRDRGMDVEVFIGKNTEVLHGDWQFDLWGGVLWFGLGLGGVKLQLVGVGKI